MFYHHHAATPYSGEDGDGFDVIETNEISIWHRSLQVEFGFDTVEEAIERADELAAEFDARNAIAREADRLARREALQTVKGR